MMKVRKYVFQPYPKAISLKPMPKDPATPPIKGPHNKPAKTQKKFPKCTLLVPKGIETKVPAKHKAIKIAV